MVKKAVPSPKAAEAVRRGANSAKRAYEAIRELVIDFQLKPEERINEVQLAQSLNLSRTPVREALNRLASEGFLVFAPNRGFFFRALDIDGLMRIFELRSIVETGSFALACDRASRDELAEMASFWDAALKRYAHGDPDEILDLDERFHLTLASLSHNPEIVQSLTGINARIRFVRRIQIARSPTHPRLVEEHSQLVDALQRRSARAGTTILRHHISLSIEDATMVLKEALFKIFSREAGSSSQAVSARQARRRRA
jgi:DNA-binding GntR family transcriptional regulator